jgi:hypothetical protein
VFETPNRSRTVLPAWMLDAGVCAAITVGPPRVAISSMLELRSVLLGLIGAHPPSGSRSIPMKTLPPAPSQLKLLPRHDHARFAVEPSARHELLRALAEILLVATEAVGRREEGDEAR